MAIISFEDTLGCLAVESLGDDVYTAPNISMPYYRIFGGQLLAQSIAIASHTAPDKQVKSLHVSFPREGDLAAPVRYRVERLQEGRTFAGRSIIGEQDGQPVVAALVMLHADELGPAHQVTAPALGTPSDAVAEDLAMIPWETRIVGGVDLATRSSGPAEYAFWMRAPGMPTGPMPHQALFAHATDLTLIGTSLRPLDGIGQADSPEMIHTAVTTHTVWFHRRIALDDWILVSQTSPVMAGGRGFGQGHAFDLGGGLVASFAQESLVRQRADR
jgi:acyl-CoA thioesterase-2